MSPAHSYHKTMNLLLAMVLGLVVVACQRFAQEAPASPAHTPTQAAPIPTAMPTPAPLVPTSNRILYVGNDFAIYTINPDGTDQQRLTQERGQYTWPTWSPDGSRIAFSSFSQGPLEPGNALYSVGAAGSGLALLFENAPDSGPAVGLRAPHYSLWSPDGQYLAFVAMGEMGLSLYLVALAGQGDPEFIAAGAPLYLAWSHDSKSLLVHRGSTLLRVEVDMGAPQRLWNLEAGSASYRAPALSPTLDLTAFLVTEGPRETLYIAQSDGSKRRALGQLQGFGSFLWAPQGDRLAVGQSFDNSDSLLQDIWLIDIESGTIQPLVQQPVLAFFWSPDGSKIAYVTTNDSQAALQWRVININTRQDRELVDFHPSSDQLIWLAHFDQYASSHQVWSPDSRRLVFAGALAEDAREGNEEGRTSRVFVVETESNAPPQAIAAGVMATWSVR